MVNPPISAAALIKNISIFCAAYLREALISKRNEKRTEIMCQNLLTERIVQNVVEIIILFVFFPYNNPNISISSEKTLLLSVFDFLDLRDPHFQEIR